MSKRKLRQEQDVRIANTAIRYVSMWIKKTSVNNKIETYNNILNYHIETQSNGSAFVLESMRKILNSETPSKKEIMAMYIYLINEQNVANTEDNSE